MAKDNSSSEYLLNIERVEQSIIQALFKNGNVVIPDFGHLELKSLGDRRTVLFKSIKNNNLYAQLMSMLDENDSNDLSTVISNFLKEGKEVNLPQLGLFRPTKRENDDIHISFIPSLSLRNLLNEGKEKGKEIEAKVESVQKEVSDIQKDIAFPVVEDEMQKDGKISDKINVPENVTKPVAVEPNKNGDTEQKRKTYSPYVPKPQPKVGETIVPQDDGDKKTKTKSINNLFFFIIALIVIAVVVLTTIYSLSDKKADEHKGLTLPSESVSLPTLSEQHYGHPAFWIYIYMANTDKLSSPVNIPKNVSLVIPDLESEYGIDATDSVEIQKANSLADSVLKEKIITNKNNNK